MFPSCASRYIRERRNIAAPFFDIEFGGGLGTRSVMYVYGTCRHSRPIVHTLTSNTMDSAHAQRLCAEFLDIPHSQEEHSSAHVSGVSISPSSKDLTQNTVPSIGCIMHAKCVSSLHTGYCNIHFLRSAILTPRISFSCSFSRAL